MEFDELNEAVSRLYYGDTTGQFVGLMAKLQDYEVFDWRNTVNWMECDEKPAPRSFLRLTLQRLTMPTAP